MFALIDCTNFYASCERVFQPGLQGKPMVVLSNRGGCVVARSDEAKELGIEMGAPFFKIKDTVRDYNVHVCASNFALYGDLSRRVMDIIQSHIQDVEIYSVDEAFVEFTKNTSTEKAMEWGRDLRQKILRWTGLPTRVGIGATKTLAKLGNVLAKQSTQGVVYVDPTDQALFKDLPIKTIWGFGSQLEKRLKRYGIHTVGHLLTRNREWIRKVLTVQGERTYYELKGVVCYLLSEAIEDDQKSLVVTRSFETEVRDLETLKESLVHYANTAGIKLRCRGLWAYTVGAYIRSSPFKDGYYSNVATIELNQPTQDTRVLINAAQEALGHIYRSGVGYKKSGLMLGNLTNVCEPRQYDLLDDERLIHTTGQVAQRSPAIVLEALDRLNQKYGRHTVMVGSLPPNTTNGEMLRNPTSPHYTTRWTDLPKV